MTDNFCLKTSPMWQFVGYGLYALKILVPLLIIILGVVDFAKASVNNDDKAINSALKTLIQRLIMGIVIFFIPSVVDVVIGLVSNTTDTKDKIEGCKTCLLKPTGEDCKDIKLRRKK